MTRARMVGGCLALVTVAGLTACVQVPDKGAVVEARQPVRAEQFQAPGNIPPPPGGGAEPAEIVSGFLDAMTATPLQTSSAKTFLSTQGQAAWRPEDRVITYSGLSPVQGTDQVAVRLQGADQVGAGGNWLGSVPRAQRRLVFPMMREDGEWRIAAAPDALIIPRDFFDENFTDAALYYFDPTGRILVPEPVHVPQGSQLASYLVRDLLRAPRSTTGSVTQTFIPPGLSVSLSVPVNHRVAEVNLKGHDPGPLAANIVRRMLAQFAWTLRQDTTISAFTLTIAGRAVTDDAGASRFPVDDSAYDRYDPTVEKASGQAYALRRGRLVSGQIERPTPVDGPFGRDPLGIGDFAVRLDGSEVAGVTPTALLIGPVQGPAPSSIAQSGTGFLRPAWDFANRLWEVQDTPSGAVVEYLVRDKWRQVRMPGITKQDVRRFLVSRDGSRIVAVLHGPDADRIVVTRIQYDVNGRAIGTDGTHVLPWVSGGTTRIRDIGWTSPTTIAVLDQLSPAKAEVRILDVDGSTPPDQAAPTLVSGRVRELVTSPVDRPYALQQSGLIDISPVDVNKQIPLTGYRHVTYAG
jgi:lipoprotein LpqB-like beta-propeller protein/sporulation and spore germination protein